MRRCRPWTWLSKSVAKADVTARAKGSLRALNFFMADMQSGIGPFVGVFLLAHGWLNGSIGSVMTIGSIAGVPFKDTDPWVIVTEYGTLLRTDFQGDNLRTFFQKRVEYRTANP